MFSFQNQCCAVLVFGHYFGYWASYQALKPLVLRLELELDSKLKLKAGTNLQLEPYPKSKWPQHMFPIGSHSSFSKI
jgi:hypothetical protein